MPPRTLITFLVLGFTLAYALAFVWGGLQADSWRGGEVDRREAGGGFWSCPGRVRHWATGGAWRRVCRGGGVTPGGLTGCGTAQ